MTGSQVFQMYSRWALDVITWLIICNFKLLVGDGMFYLYLNSNVLY